MRSRQIAGYEYTGTMYDSGRPAHSCWCAGQLMSAHLADLAVAIRVQLLAHFFEVLFRKCLFLIRLCIGLDLGRHA